MASINKLNKRQKKRLAKLLVILDIYHHDPEWYEDKEDLGEIKKYAKDYVVSLCKKLNFPEKVLNIASFSKALNYIKEN